MMTMQEFYERATRRVDARDNTPKESYVEVEVSYRRLCGALRAKYQLSDLKGPEPHRLITGRSPEECLLLWDTVNCGEPQPSLDSVPATLQSTPDVTPRATHLGNGEVQ